jgi:hypothetical protein
VEAYGSVRPKGSVAIALSAVIVSHLFMLWLWVQSSSSVRVRADSFAHWQQTIIYLPSEPRDVVEVQLPPQISHKPAASLKVINGAKLAGEEIQRLKKVGAPSPRSDHSAGPPDTVQTKADVTSTAESVGESSWPAVADTRPVAPVGAASATLPSAQLYLFDSPIAMRRQARQRSLVDVVNQQLNPDGPRDRLKQGIEDAALPVCLASNEAGGILSPIVIAYAALRGKCKLP